MSNAIFDQVRGIAADVFSLPAGSIMPASSPETIASWDSIQHLNLVLALEERFGMQVTPEEIEQMRTIGQVAELVESKVQSAAK